MDRRTQVVRLPPHVLIGPDRGKHSLCDVPNRCGFQSPRTAVLTSDPRAPPTVSAGARVVPAPQLSALSFCLWLTGDVAVFCEFLMQRGGFRILHLCAKCSVFASSHRRGSDVWMCQTQSAWGVRFSLSWRGAELMGVPCRSQVLTPRTLLLTAPASVSFPKAFWLSNEVFSFTRDFPAVTLE